jgi:predicted nucleic acid-binding protein
MSAESARIVVMDYLAWQVVENSRHIFVSSITAMEIFHVSFRDASIIAAAQAGGAVKLYSGDLNHCQSYGQLMVVNPFKVD